MKLPAQNPLPDETPDKIEVVITHELITTTKHCEVRTFEGMDYEFVYPGRYLVKTTVYTGTSVCNSEIMPINHNRDVPIPPPLRYTVRME
jgi:hypothetical protein